MKGKGYNLVKALSWYTIGSVLIKSVNFFTLRLFTNLLTTTDYGIFGIYQSYLSIFEMIILFGTSHTIKMVKYDSKTDYEQYVQSIIYIPILGTVALVVLTRIVFCFTTNIADLSQGIWYAIFVSAGAAAVCNIIVGKLILEGEYKKYVTYSLINTLLNLSVSIILCYTLFKSENTYWARIIGGLSANVFSSLFLMVYTKMGRPQIAYIKKGILMGIPLLVHAIATQILVQTDKIAISHLASYSAVGIYSAAASLVVIPSTILTSVENSWSPWYYEKLSQKEYAVIKGKNTTIIGLFATGIAFIVLISPEIVRMMTNQSYWDAIYVLIPLTISVYAELLYIVPLNLELYYKKNKAIWIYTLVAVVINIICDIIFIQYFGYLAGAYVTCATRLLLFALHYRRAKRIDKHDTLDFRVVILTVIGLFVTGGFVVLLAEKWIIRWIAAIAIMIAMFICYLKRKRQ